ncbi:MAG: PAS domain S-box protein [Thermoflexales bacterium]|nr:PAS domain S-box protein [Thermoflexales bacterium]
MSRSKVEASTSRQAEIHLRESEERFRTAFEYAGTGMSLTGLDGRFIQVNTTLCKMLGYSQAELLGVNFQSITLPDDRSIGAEARRQLLAGEIPSAFFEKRYLHKDGHSFWTHLTISLLRDRAGQPMHFVAQMQDITKRKKMEEALRESERRLAALYQEVQREKQYFESLALNNPVATAVIDLDRHIVSWNPAAEKLLGYTPAEAIGHDIDKLVATDATRAEAVAYSRQSTEEGARIHAITQRRHKDGTLVDVELLSVPVVVEGKQAGVIAIYHDITELQRARQEAEVANRTKSAFLATMSHEIRTPMNGVIGMTNLLLDTELTADQRDYAETVRASGEALLTIINDILDFSKIEAGRMELEKQAFDLHQCVESALDLIAPKAAEKGVELAYLFDLHTPRLVIGDVTRVRQILINLLGNAIKFTERGEILVSVTSQPQAADYELHFMVQDTGIGIPPDRMDHLFKSFSQVDASTTRKYGGTGLGLVICQRLSQMMGGAMWVESDGVPGKGSLFHFTVRVEATLAPERADMYTEQPQLNGRRVLIVDDNATNRRILTAQTLAWKMLAAETASPLEALEWIRRGDSFDVAILDMHMPEMDGLTLAAEMRRYRDARSLPLIMLSSLGRRGTCAEATQFAACLAKPVKQSQLHNALAQIFTGQSIMRTLEPLEAPRFDTRLAERLPMQVLLAEDNVTNQKLALHMLRKLGYRADVAGNGLEVLQALERQLYDVILMDVQMPEMDGLEATRHIRQKDLSGFGNLTGLSAQPRIIAMTANAMQGDREMCLEAGMDDYVSKPVQIRELQSALERQGRAPADRVESVAELETPAVDWAVLDGLHELQEAGKPDFVQEVIGLYLAEAPALIGAIRQAIAGSVPGALRFAAHTLKGNSDSLGVKQVGAVSRELEKLGRNGTLEGATSLLAELENEFKRAILELDRPQRFSPLPGGLTAL